MKGKKPLRDLQKFLDKHKNIAKFINLELEGDYIVLRNNISGGLQIFEDRRTHIPYIKGVKL